MIDVTVKVPEDRLGEFYALVGRFLSGELQSADLEQDVLGDPSLKEWSNSDEDLPLAREVWSKLSVGAIALFSRLMDCPGQRVPGDELAAEAGIPKGKYGIAGALGWPGRYCTAVHRAAFWHWEYVPDGRGAEYWMDEEIADLFNKVRK